MADYSPRFSLKGWKFWKWLGGNWKSIKEALKLLGPGVYTWINTQNPELAFIVGVVCKFGLDVIEYYVKEYIIE